jgi:hypothetical protein
MECPTGFQNEESLWGCLWKQRKKSIGNKNNDYCSCLEGFCIYTFRGQKAVCHCTRIWVRSLFLVVVNRRVILLSCLVWSMHCVAFYCSWLEQKEKDWSYLCLKHHFTATFLRHIYNLTVYFHPFLGQILQIYATWVGRPTYHSVLSKTL